jgi:hypothetical protein
MLDRSESEADAIPGWMIVLKIGVLIVVAILSILTGGG